jgi:hypothetical protein
VTPQHRSSSTSQRDSLKKGRNHTENRAPRKNTDTTPTKGSSNDEEVVGKSAEMIHLFNQSSGMGESPLQREKKSKFSSQVLISKVEQIQHKTN